MEHGNISDSMMHEIVAATAACGASPIVRIMIKRALDASAHGILVPSTNSAEDERNIVRYSKYPPIGTRGYESGLVVEKFVEQRPHGGGVVELTGVEYLEQANSSLVIAMQIEAKAGLENVKEIATVPGKLVLAIQQVHEAAKFAAKPTGIYCDTEEQVRKYANKGFQMISVMTDLEGIRNVFGQAFDAAKVDRVQLGIAS